MVYFDPYHKWLGIPPDEQPPDHYRLLGIRRFEADPDVIEAAGDQRMAHLRTYQAGKHGELSQRLLNEVATAKVCLLNRDKKTAYDANLKEQEAARDLTSQQSLDRVESYPAPPPLEPAPIQVAPVLPQITSAAPTHRVAQRPRSKRTAPAAFLLVTVVLLFGAIGLTFLLKGPSSYEAPAGRASSGSDQRQTVNAGTKAAVTNKKPAVKPLTSLPIRERDGGERAAPKVTELAPVTRPVPTEQVTEERGESPHVPTAVPQMPPDLIVHLTFEPEAFFHDDGVFLRDVSDHGSPVRVVGAVTDEGKIGKGLRFDGKHDRVILGEFDFNRPFTFSVWAKPNWKRDIQAILGSLTKPSRESDGFRFQINHWQKKNRSIEFAIACPQRGKIEHNRRVVVAPDHTVEFGRWQHLALVVDFPAGTAAIFHNGKKVAERENLIQPIPAAAPWRLGDFMERKSAYDGNMDEVMLFARALSEGEIQNVYELGLQAKSP